jgi:hypothetical protein
MPRRPSPQREERLRWLASRLREGPDYAPVVSGRNAELFEALLVDNRRLYDLACTQRRIIELMAAFYPGEVGVVEPEEYEVQRSETEEERLARLAGLAERLIHRPELALKGLGRDLRWLIERGEE